MVILRTSKQYSFKVHTLYHDTLYRYTDTNVPNIVLTIKDLNKMLHSPLIKIIPKTYANMFIEQVCRELFPGIKFLHIN